MTDITWEQARDRVACAECLHLIGKTAADDFQDFRHQDGSVFCPRKRGQKRTIATPPRMTSPQPDAQPTELPPHWCKILEPNNPDFSEKFACNDCGENFITMCSYARLKATLQAERTLREQTVAIVTEWTEREAACCPEDVGFDELIGLLRAEVTDLREELATAHRFGMQWHQLWLLNSGKKFCAEEWAAEYVAVFNGQFRAETAEAENTRLRSALEKVRKHLEIVLGDAVDLSVAYRIVCAALSPAEGKGGQA